MGRYVLKRLGGICITMALVSVVVFYFIRLIPGDPASLMLGEKATPEAIAVITEKYGLDKSIPEQYVLWMKGALQGDLGDSIRTKMPVTYEIAARYGNTVKLSVLSMGWSIIAGLIIGIWSGTNASKWQDYTGISIAVLGQAIPQFWVGLMLILVFSVNLKWFPILATSSIKGLFLPCLTMGIGMMATVARFTRSSLLEVLKEDYTRTARAKGLRENTVIYKHVLKNSVIPVITIIGMQFGVMLGGAVLVESVFGYSGIGLLLIESIKYRDYTTLQALVLLISLHFVVINLGVDLLYAAVNPEIRLD